MAKIGQLAYFQGRRLDGGQINLPQPASGCLVGVTTGIDLYAAVSHWLAALGV